VSLGHLLSERPEAPILIVSDNAYEAAAKTLSGYIVISPSQWNGDGLGALRGRKVDFWPDANSLPAAHAMAQEIVADCQKVRILRPIDAPSSTWNIAEAIAAGWTVAQIREWAKDRLTPISALVRQVPASRKVSAVIKAEDRTKEQLWEQLDLARNERGPYATEANALKIITAHPAYAGKIWYDEFANRLMLETEQGDESLDEIRMIQMQVWMQQALWLPKMPLVAIERACRIAGAANPVHPVREWLQGLVWDQTERLSTFMADGFGAAQNDYTAAVGRCWITAMVARVMHPGCQADNMPVFEGAQGIHKSTAMRILGGPWFTESSEDPLNGRKDFLLALQGKWLVEIPEMHAIASRFSGIEKIKAIISIRVDSYRVPYGRNTEDYPRQCVFVGTTNADEWNADPTGGRRFWPIRCGAINTEYLTREREQLFAEALARYQRGESWWDVPVTDAAKEQENRRQSDAWEEVIERYVTHYPDRHDMSVGLRWHPRTQDLEKLTLPELLGEALGLPEGRWDRASQMRVSSCLTALGWRRARVTTDTGRKWAYVKYPKLFD